MLNVYWLEQTETDLPAENHWLSANETLCLSTMRFAKRRADWRRGRWAAKCALSLYLNLPAHPQVLASIEIRPAPSGAPEVFVANQPAPVTISLSHRSDVAACAIAPSAVALGCDLEVIEPRSDGFMADYFTREEQGWLEGAPVTERPRLLALLWSAKESALKALRAGLRLDTRSVTVRPADAQLYRGEEGSWRRLRVVATEGRIFHGWWQQTGNLLRTVVATPPPGPPTLLEPQLRGVHLCAIPG